MKKGLLVASMAAILGCALSANAGDDVLVIDAAGGTTVMSGGATATKKATAISRMSNAGNTSYTDSGNAVLNNTFNDVNSDNVTSVVEDGLVVHANDLNQAVALSDSELVNANNEVLVDSALNDSSSLSKVTNTVQGLTRSEQNTLMGSFSGIGGLSAVSQSTGSTTAIAQSVNVQSNGGI